MLLVLDRTTWIFVFAFDVFAVRVIKQKCDVPLIKLGERFVSKRIVDSIIQHREV